MWEGVGCGRGRVWEGVGCGIWEGDPSLRNTDIF